MLYGFLSVLYIVICLFIVLIILIQRGKGTMGLGGLGGGAQMLFGGSGGQDLFQKITWVLGIILIGGSLGLSLYKMYQVGSTGYRQPVEHRAPAAPEPIDLD